MSATRAETHTQTRMLAPPLKWAGGKRWLVPHLAPIRQTHAPRRADVLHSSLRQRWF